MKFEKIKYSKFFKLSEEWIGMDIILEEGDDPLQAYAKARGIAEAAYMQNPGVAEKVIHVEKLEDRAVGLYVSDIMSCKNLVVLDSYVSLIKNKPDLEKAYNHRREVLIGMQSKD